MQDMDQLLDHLEENQSLIITIFKIIKSIELFIIGPDHNMNIWWGHAYECNLNYVRG